MHTLARKFGTARIEHELRAKGVGRAAIAKIATELERAREAWQKRFRAPPASAAQRAKQMRFLQGRGFSFDVIRRVVAGTEDD